MQLEFKKNNKSSPNFSEGLNTGWLWSILPLGVISFSAYIYILGMWMGVASFWIPLIMTGLLIGFGSYKLSKSIEYKSITHQESIAWDGKVMLGLLLLTGIFVFDHAAMIAGGWDAWAMWNVHARFLTDAKVWKQMLHPALDWNSPDYPLLLPSVNAWWMQIMKGETSFFSGYLTAFISFLSLLMLCFHAFKKWIWGVALICLLMTNNYFVELIVYQGADTFMGIMIAVVLLLVHNLETNKEIANAPILKALFIGLMAFFVGNVLNSKNESLIFVGLFLLIFHKLILQNWKSFLLGIILPLFVFAIFKWGFAPKGFMGTATNVLLIKNLGSWERYQIVFEHAKQVIGDYYISILPYLGMFIVDAIKHKKLSKLGLSLIATFIVYHFVYIFYNFSLKWQLDTSYSRIIMQLYIPMMVHLIILWKNNFETKRIVSIN